MIINVYMDEKFKQKEQLNIDARTMHVPDGSTVADILHILRVPEGEISRVAINDKEEEKWPGAVLKDGDELWLA